MKNIGVRADLRKVVAAATWAILLCGNLPQPAGADPYFDYGLKVFQQRNFKLAAQYFDMRLKSNPNDTYAQYYRGLCYHCLGDIDRARELYQSVIANGIDARVRGLAENQMKRIESISTATAAVSPGKHSSSPPPSGAASPGMPPGPDEEEGQSGPTIVPQNARAYFTVSPGGNDIILEGKINGRGLHFKFDTGAHSIFLGKNHLQQLGMQMPQGKPTGRSQGVGGVVETWSVKANVTVGGITKRLPLTIAEEYESDPLLGQMFFEDIEYEIDNKGRCIYFRKPQDIAVLNKSDMYAIPFTKRGKHLVVELEGPKGRKTSMLVDTGAYSVLFSKRNLADLNIDIPSDAEKSYFHGVGGDSSGYKFHVDELRLGPIIMRNIPVVADTGEKGAIGAESAREGLLGQEFFSSWRFAVDNKNQRLRFFH